jgi:hypothetical protein
MRVSGQKCGRDNIRDFFGGVAKSWRSDADSCVKLRPGP